MASIRTERETEYLGRKNTSYELDNYGIKSPARVYWNLNAAEPASRADDENLMKS